jgi:hypothetical protein
MKRRKWKPEQKAAFWRARVTSPVVV